MEVTMAEDKGHFPRLTLGEECLEPSSWWSPEMMMLQDEARLPLDLARYCKYEPYTERKYNHWHFFAPHHVFRLPSDTEYLIAQRGKSNQLRFRVRDQMWMMTTADGELLDSDFLSIISKM